MVLVARQRVVRGRRDDELARHIHRAPGAGEGRHALQLARVAAHYGGGDDHLTANIGFDTLSGSDGNDELRAGPNGDTLLGQGGNDELVGEKGDDTAWGGEGDDNVRGAADTDTLFGGAGADRLFGGPGNDRIVALAAIDVQLPGGDYIRSGRGNDVVRVRDGDGDRVLCGPGSDIVYADFHDKVKPNCEVAKRDRPEAGADAEEISR